MKQYRGKIRGEFEKTQLVYANSEEEARDMLESNQGEDIEDTAITIPDILEFEEVS